MKYSYIKLTPPLFHSIFNFSYLKNIVYQKIREFYFFYICLLIIDETNNMKPKIKNKKMKP